MAGAVLQPEDVGALDAARILDFVNGVADASVLADTIGFSEGPPVGRQIAEAILERRTTGGPLRTLDELLAVTGVNLARFTEIAVALSGARPPAAGWTMVLTPTTFRPWLGQSVQIAGQLLDAQGLAVLGAEIGCVASSGILTAPNSLGEMQRGAAVRLATEPGGIVRLELQPPLAHPLFGDAKSALESELGRLGTETDSPADVAPELAAFAARYRAEGSSALREAVDRLFEAYPVDTPGVGASWPVETVTIIAIAEGGNGQPTLVGTATLFFRNWLGGWLLALGGAIGSDRRLDEALAAFDFNDADADAANGLIAATQAFAGLEYGVVGGRERDKLGGQSASRFLDRLGENLDPDLMENVVRAAGATSAATAAGGFAVFEAINSVQSVSDAIGPKRGIDAGTLGIFDGRLLQLETNAVTRTALDTLRADILTRTDIKVADFGGRVTALETDRVTKAQLAGLDAGLAAAVKDLRAGIDTAVGRARTELTAQIGAKADLAAVTGLNQSFTTLIDGRLAQIEARALDRGALDTLRTDLITLTDGKVAAVSVKVAALETDRVTRAQLAGLDAGLAAAVKDLRAGIDTAVGRARTELTAQIGAKADLAAVTGLNQSFKTLVDGRLAQLEARILDRGALDSLRADLITLTDGKVAAVNVKVAALETDRVTRAQLAGLEALLTQRIATDLTKALGTTRAELLVQINAKADQTAVAGLSQSFTRLQTESQRLATQVQGVDFDVLRAARPRPPGPGR